MTRAEKLLTMHGLFTPYLKPLHKDVANAAGHVPGVPRLGIPALRESDASLGVANNIEQRKGDTASRSATVVLEPAPRPLIIHRRP